MCKYFLFACTSKRQTILSTHIVWQFTWKIFNKYNQKTFNGKKKLQKSYIKTYLQLIEFIWHTIFFHVISLLHNQFCVYKKIKIILSLLKFNCSSDKVLFQIIFCALSFFFFRSTSTVSLYWKSRFKCKLKLNTEYITAKSRVIFHCALLHKPPRSFSFYLSISLVLTRINKPMIHSHILRTYDSGITHRLFA